MPVRILHVHSTFSLGGKEARAVRLMNAFGDTAHHTVLSAVPDAFSARDAIDPAIRVDFPIDHPPIVGKPEPGRYLALSRYMRRFDLVLTYNWGAMDAVGARRLFGGPPLIHHEDGFNLDEAQRQKPARVWFRRLMLGAASAVVVPSHTLEAIALTSWRQPRHRVRRITNGIPLQRYGDGPVSGSIPGLREGNGPIIGTMAGLRSVKNLPRLVRAYAQSGLGGQLVVVGEGPERETIRSAAQQAGVSDRLVMPGFLADPARYVGFFDLFALSSDSEQQPISLIEAMAAGLPAVTTDVGDIRHMVDPANLPYIVPVDAEDRFAAALKSFDENPLFRKEIGAANRAKALQFFDETSMMEQYRALYSGAMGQGMALG